MADVDEDGNGEVISNVRALEPHRYLELYSGGARIDLFFRLRVGFIYRKPWPRQVVMSVRNEVGNECREVVVSEVVMSVAQ